MSRDLDQTLSIVTVYYLGNITVEETLKGKHVTPGSVGSGGGGVNLVNIEQLMALLRHCHEVTNSSDSDVCVGRCAVGQGDEIGRFCRDLSARDGPTQVPVVSLGE